MGPRSANPTAGVLDASSRVGGSRPSQRTRSSETTRSARGARAASRTSRSPGAASTTTRCQSLRRRAHPVLTRWRVLSMHGRCLFHHNPMAVAPIGIPGFFWGRPGERLVEQARPSPPCLSHSMTFEDPSNGLRWPWGGLPWPSMTFEWPSMALGRPSVAFKSPSVDFSNLRLAFHLPCSPDCVQMLEHYPSCLKDEAGGSLGGTREGACLRRHGLMEWFTLHLQVRTRLRAHARACAWPHTTALGCHRHNRPWLRYNRHRRHHRLVVSPTLRLCDEFRCAARSSPSTATSPQRCGSRPSGMARMRSPCRDS